MGHVLSCKCISPPAPQLRVRDRCRFALVLGSPALKAACQLYDAGTHSLQAGAVAVLLPPPASRAHAAAEVCAVLHTRTRNHEDVVVSPCYTLDPASCVPVELLDLPGLQLPPDDMLGDTCHPECGPPVPSLPPPPQPTAGT